MPRLASALLILALAALGCRADSSSPPAPASGEAPPQSAAERSEPTRPEGVIYRSELLRATRDGSPAYLMAQLGPEPYRRDGRFAGWLVTRIWPADPELCAAGCDLKVGDVIVEVNGSPLATPEQLSDLLEDLEALERLEVSLLRDGQPLARSYTIVDDPPG